MLFRLSLLVMLSLGYARIAHGNAPLLNQDQHVEITMRMLGHQVLLASGDSSSLVKPVEREGNKYKIRFEAEFGFTPDSVAIQIDSIIRATNISENYIVEFISCDSQKVTYGYEVNEEADVLACRGREYPKACYVLVVTLLDTNPTQEASVISPLGIALVIALILSILALVVFFRRKPNVGQDVHTVQIGDFVFDSRNMQLSYKNERIELTSKESDLLQLLFNSVNNTVERDDILKSVWGDDGDYVGRTLDVFISKLRKKLEADVNIKIINIRGIGYKLVLND